MKKLQSLLAGAVIALGFAACEDVPAPYGVYNEGDDHTVTDVILSADFSTSLGAFQNVTTDGEGAWIIDYKTAKATGYDNGTKVTTAGTYYLVSPEVTVPEGPTHITFDYILRYNKGDENQQLLINENYNADNPTEGWVVLNQKWTEGSDWTTFEAADVAVPEDYAGKTVRVALRYSTNATSGSTWEVQSFSVLEGEGAKDGDQGNGSTANTDPQEGDGTMDNPYNVAAAQAAYTGTELVGKAVTGYIVGYCSGTTIGTAKFELGNDVVNTNLLIADNPEETNPNKCVAIQLARGNARTALNLKDNPFNFGMKVLVEGTLFGPYLGMTGVKSLTYYQIVR